MMFDLASANTPAEAEAQARHKLSQMKLIGYWAIYILHDGNRYHSVTTGTSEAHANHVKAYADAEAMQVVAVIEL